MEKKKSGRLAGATAYLMLLAAASLLLSCDRRQGSPKRSSAEGPRARTWSETGPPTIALALSGGGYRASLHGLAALKALDSFGLLDDVRIVSGVSGGSITAGYYAYYRASSGDLFSYQGFESKLLTAIATYEVPRSVLAAELLATGNETAETLVRCARENAVAVVGFGGFKRFQQAVRKCAGEASLGMGGTSLLEAIDQFVGEGCSTLPGPGSDALQACVDRGPDALGARLTATLVAGALGEDISNDMQRSFCSLALKQCAALSQGEPRAAVKRPDSDHPFADLLHLALFKPWKTDQSVVRMNDLKAAGLTVLINAASNTHGELWTASQNSAGIRQPLHSERVGTWQRYGQSPGPALADAVAASACHPLFCRPIQIPLGGSAGSGTLTDGGIHDNLGVLAIKELVQHEPNKPDLLLVADAHRPYTGTKNPTSRVDTVFRVHDMLIDQRSASTIREVGDWWEGRCRRPVYVSLVDADPASEPLSQLTTDLRPIREPASQILSSAVRRFKQKLSRNPCVASWLQSGSPGKTGS